MIYIGPDKKEDPRYGESGVVPGVLCGDPQWSRFVRRLPICGFVNWQSVKAGQHWTRLFCPETDLGHTLAIIL